VLVRAPMSDRRMWLRDRYLESAVRELLDNDARLVHPDVQVRFDGAVAHVEGAVEDPADLRVLRDPVGRLGGVLAVWDRVRVAGREPVVVDLGCGDTKQRARTIGLDICPSQAADVVADVRAPPPFADGSLDRVFAVLSPWWGHVNAMADPTHLRLLDVQTIKGICRRRGGGPVRRCAGSAPARRRGGSGGRPGAPPRPAPGWP
jgi:hypothetical protein